MSDPKPVAGPLDSLIADFRLARKRLKEAPPQTVEAMVSELRDNVYPSFIAIAEQIVEIDEVVFELSEDSGSSVDAELAGQIFQTLAIGAQVLEEARKHLPLLDELARKRSKDLLDAFEHSMELTIMAVQEAVTDDSPSDDEDEPEEPEPEEDEEEEEEIVIPDNDQEEDSNV